MTPVVSNTSPLINLVGVGLLSLLPSIFGTVQIPALVQGEYAAGAQPTDPQLEHLPWLTVVPNVVPDPALVTHLNPGEAAAITLAQSLNAATVLLDDRQARQVAQRLGVRVTGTLGVLIVARQHALIPALKPVLDQMRAQGRYIGPQLYASVLQQVGEQPEG
jgi:predicted nucleic acid-binding protein